MDKTNKRRKRKQKRQITRTRLKRRQKKLLCQIKENVLNKYVRINYMNQKFLIQQPNLILYYNYTEERTCFLPPLPVS